MTTRGWRRDSGLLILFPLIFTLTPYVRVCKGSNLSQSKSLVNFIRAIDPKNLLEINWDWDGSIPNNCSSIWMGGITCDAFSFEITEIRLEKINLSGIIDADSLCKLLSLKVLSLAINSITGGIPESISNCISLTYLNLSSNMLHGTVPMALSSLRNLRSLDVSNNNLTGPIPQFEQEIELIYPSTMESDTSNSTGDWPMKAYKYPKISGIEPQMWLAALLTLLLSVALISLFVFITDKTITQPIEGNKEKELVQEDPVENVSVSNKDDIEKGKEQTDLIFFSERYGRFSMDDLLKSGANLQGHSIHGSLYKVKLNSSATFAVKRLKNLQVSDDNFRQKVTWIGNLKHPNLLPLVAYHSSEDDKLLIYTYQARGSLSSLLSRFEQKKINFTWRHRLSIMSGIARGLDYIARESCEESVPHGTCEESVPHGNLKPSNILLTETGEPLISEYGIWNYADPKRALLYSSNGYRAPERRITKEADIFSFGVILLELLTGKTVERTGINLPKWVKSMVREEWTGEVFDREVNRAGRPWAFPLLNIALKCVSDLPEHRPDISEVLEKIEHAVDSLEDYSFSSPSSVESSQHDHSLIHTIIPETDETSRSS